MVDIKRISKENYQDYQEYIKVILDTIESVDDLALASGSDYCYVMSSQNGIYALVNCEDYKPHSVILNEDGEVGYYLNEKCWYQIVRGDIPTVQRVDVETKNVEQLFITTQEETGKSFLHYYQDKKETMESIKMEFEITNYLNTLDTFFSYVNSKTPDIMIFREKGNLFNRTIKKEYCKLENDDYGKVIFYFNGIAYISGRSKYSLEELFSIIKSRGFKTSIPEVLMNIFMNHDEQIKSLQKVVSSYTKCLKN